eukprot:6415187-Prymnesium_polylepis.1
MHLRSSHTRHGCCCGGSLSLRGAQTWRAEAQSRRSTQRGARDRAERARTQQACQPVRCDARAVRRRTSGTALRAFGCALPPCRWRLLRSWAKKPAGRGEGGR